MHSAIFTHRPSYPAGRIDVRSISAVAAEVEDLLFERGIDLCHETVRLWWNRFGPMFAADIRRRRANAMRGFRYWRWHLCEACTIFGVPSITKVRSWSRSSQGDKSVALEFMRRILKRYGRAEAIVTGGLKSCSAAMRELGNLER